MLKILTTASPLLVLLALTTLSDRAFGAPLNLNSHPPDVHASAVQVTYTAGATPTITISGTADQITQTDNTVAPIFSGVFTLNETFSKSGTGASATLTPLTGLLDVHGKIGSAGASDTSIFHSILPGLFGFTTTTGSTPNETFEFTFDLNLAVILHTKVPTSYGTNFFDASFNNTDAPAFLFINSAADVYAPEPATLAMLGSAGLILFTRRRGRS